MPMVAQRLSLRDTASLLATAPAVHEVDDLDLEVTVEVEEPVPPTLRSRTGEAPRPPEPSPSVVCSWLGEPAAPPSVEPAPWSDESPTTPQTPGVDRVSQIRSCAPPSRARRG